MLGATILGVGNVEKDISSDIVYLLETNCTVNQNEETNEIKLCNNGNK